MQQLTANSHEGQPTVCLSSAQNAVRIPTGFINILLRYTTAAALILDLIGTTEQLRRLHDYNVSASLS